MTFKNYLTEKLKEKSKKIKKRILFVDGSDQRAIKAAMLHDSDGILTPVILYRNKDEVTAKVDNFILMEDWKEKEDVLIEKYLEVRKGKEDKEQAKKAVWERATFAMLMLALHEVDGVLGGLENPTADILKAAFKVIGPKPGTKTISSVMLMERASEWYIFGDISVNIEPNKDQLVDIAINASEFAKGINFKTKVAFLSFSTSGSAVHPRSQMVHEATTEFNERYKPKYMAIGEVQFDAAFSPKVREQKYKDEGFKKNPTILIFPSLEAGNIGYKIAQRMGGFGAIGPILTGINKPVNDLSRGAETIDVYNTALLTALQSYE